MKMGVILALVSSPFERMKRIILLLAALAFIAFF